MASVLHSKHALHPHTHANACARDVDRIVNVMQLGTWVLDFVAGLLFRIHYIRNVSIERLGNFVEVTFKNPRGFSEDASGCVPRSTEIN